MPNGYLEKKVKNFATPLKSDWIKPSETKKNDLPGFKG